MKIALCSSFVPFVYGGYRNIVDWLKIMLERSGHEVEQIYLPEVDSPDLLFKQMMAFRWIDLSAADRVICFRPQSHLIRHPHKILWFIHHIRIFYDLWHSPYNQFGKNLKLEGFRKALNKVDTLALKEAKKVFTNSKVIKDRLYMFNNIDSEVLYPPLFNSDAFCCKSYNNEIVYICRLEHHKRQHLLIESMQYVKTPICLRVCGVSFSEEYVIKLKNLIVDLHLKKRVILENRWISEEEKIEYLANCLAAAYLPLDEDSYGYPTLEACFARKAVLTTNDAGGVLELVKHDVNGYIAEPSPQSIANALDKLYLDLYKTKKMGNNAYEYISKLNIHWDHVISRLLA